MEIQELKEILNSGLPDDLKKIKVIDSLAKDEEFIPNMMLILKREREIKKEIHDEMNLLLSKSHIALDSKELNKNGFIQNEIVAFYAKYRDYVGHCFKKLFV